MCNTTATAPRVSFTAMIASAQAAGIVVSHLINPSCAVVPSATERDTLYILVLVNGAWICNCPAPGRCWHQDRAEGLALAARGQADTPNPQPTTQPAPAPQADTDHRYIALRDELYGAWVA